MSPTTLLVLSADDVRRALPMRDAIDAMKEALRLLSAGEAVVPPRTHLAAGAAGDVLVMPAGLPSAGRMGVKVISLMEGNRDLGLPLIQAVVLVCDSRTGRPVGVLDGAALTALRTGAASGAATDLLARPDASVAAVFGAGVQARAQLEAVCAVRPIRRARVFDPAGDRAAAMAREMADRLGVAVEAAAEPAEALRSALVVSTATTARSPVFDDADLEPGAHVNAVGSYKPAVREVPPETVARARVIVDQRAAAMAEAGDLLLPLAAGLIRPEHIAAELGEIVAGTKPGRQSPDQVTLFKSVGVAVQDVAAADRALANAARLGLGTSVPL